MNKNRRNMLSKCIAKLVDLINEIENIKQDEELSFDNLPENLQSSMRGENMEEAIEYLDNSLDNLNSALDELESIE